VTETLDTVPETGTSGHGRPISLGDLVSLLTATALLVAAVVAPIVGDAEWRINIFALAPPLFGEYDPHAGFGTAAAVLVAITVIAYGPTLAARLSWRLVMVTSMVTCLAWTFSLAMIDGWDRGFAGRLIRPDEYLAEVPGVSSITRMLDEFSGRILDFQPDSWTTHVSGHPPGSLLTFVLLDRVGLGGGTWAAVWVVLIGCSAAGALLITTARLADEATARRIAPFVALTPGAVWMGVSADGYYMGVAAWGIALLAVAATTSGKRAVLAGVGSGLVLGFAIFLNYGLILMGVVAIAVVVIARSYRPILYAVPAALAVVGIFAAFGFWWLDGYHLVVERYYQGVATRRPFSYWGWANFASALCAVGPAAAVGLGRALRPGRIRRREAVVLLSLAGLLAMIIADLSALSKAEVERIWLPFSVWLLVATALLPRRSQRFWLAGQAITALLINHLVWTYW
jgi:methylthioxylose transferase